MAGQLPLGDSRRAVMEVGVQKQGEFWDAGQSGLRWLGSRCHELVTGWGLGVGTPTPDTPSGELGPECLQFSERFRGRGGVSSLERDAD